MPGLEIFVLFSSLNPIDFHNDLPRHLDEGHEHLAVRKLRARGERDSQGPWWAPVSIVASARQDKDWVVPAPPAFVNVA